MALESAGSPNGSQPILLSDSQRHRRSNRQDTENSKDGVKFLKWIATVVAIVTFVMGFICTKVYISYAPDLGGITGLIKKAIFMIFLLCNSITMLTSVVAIMKLIWAQHVTGAQRINNAILRAMALVTIAFVSLLVACMVGVLLVLILLPWSTYSLFFTLVRADTFYL